jgi:hypothetical protein
MRLSWAGVKFVIEAGDGVHRFSGEVRGGLGGGVELRMREQTRNVVPQRGRNAARSE